MAQSTSPGDPTSPGQKDQSRSISASFSRPGSTIDDLMARLNSPNPNPVPPAVSWSYGPPGASPGVGNGSAMSPPPQGNPIGGYPPSLFSPGTGLGGIMSPASRGAPSPLYGGSNPTPGPGTPGAHGNENRQSQLLDLLRNAGQSPSASSPSAPSTLHQPPPPNMYQQFGIGNGHPPQLSQQHSFSHHHPAMQQNNSFSGAPSTGLNRVASPTYGLSAGAGNNQAQSLLAALINGSSTPVSSAPQQEIPFAIHQPVIMDEQVSTEATANSAPSVQASAVEQSQGLARADTFGNMSKDAANGSTNEKSDHATVVDQTSAVEVGETTKPAETSQQSRLDSSAAASEATASSDASKKTFFSAFVSPFDAFDAPMAVSDSGAAGASTKKKNKKDKTVKDVPSAAAAVAPPTTKPDVSSSKPVSDQGVQKKEAAPSSSSTKALLPAAPVPKKSVKQEDIPVVYRSSAFVDSSQTTTAGIIPSAEYVFDMSEPHLDSLVHVTKPFEERRVSNIRTHVMTTGLSSGSILKAGVNLLAYALPKGKARIVNQDTAESTLVTLQQTDKSTPIPVVDLAVTDEWVVLLGNDGSFGIWKVDFGSEGRSLMCERAFFYSATGHNPVAQRIELLGLNGSTSLIIMSDDSVFSVGVEALTRTRETELTEMMEVKYGASHPNLVDLDVSPERNQIAVITRSGHFFVYTLGTAQPISQGVYVPTDGTWATSVRIINDNLLVGSSQGEFSLVPMQSSASDVTSAFISKLTFKDHGITIDPEKALWMKPRFDAKEQLLWIVSFSRASLFIIKYKESKSVSDTNSVRRRAFRKMLEFPLEALGDFTLDPCDSAAFFYKDPKGFSQASVAQHLLDLLEESAEEDVDEPEVAQQGSAAETRQHANGELPQQLSAKDTDLENSAKALDANAAEAIQQDAQQAFAVEPVTVNQDLASNKPGSGLGDVDVARQEAEIRTQPSSANITATEIPSDTSSGGLDQLRISIAQEVKQSLATQLSSFSTIQLEEIRAIRSDLMAQEAERQQTLVTLVSDVIDRDVKNLLHQIVSEQVEEKIAPMVAETLTQQAVHAFSSIIPAQINSALQETVLSQVERSLIPHLGRTFTATLSPIVERNVRALISDSLVPKFMGGVEHISDELSDVIHREMLEVRKDVLVEQSSQLKTSEAMIESMTASMKMLINQVKDLSEQVKELKSIQARPPAQQPPAAAAPPPMAPQLISVPPPVLPTPRTNQMMPQQPAQNVAPGPISAPRLSQAANVNPNIVATQQPEEEFLNALMTMGDDELIRFVGNRMNRISDYLPAPGQHPCPLSQQVLLTMIHRLSKAMAPLPTSSNEYQILLQWVVRTAYLIDGKAPDIADFFGPVRSALAADYQALIAQYAQLQDRTPPTVQAVRMMNQVLQVLGSR